MRDALSTLEQLSVFGNGAVHADDARSLLGEVSDQILGEFARAIADRDVAELYGLIRAQVEEGNDLLELTRDLVAHVRDVYVACVAGARAELFEGGSEQAEALAAEAAAFGEHPADRLARVLTVLDDAALEMRGASDVRLVLEIACTRLARPEADLTIEALAERVARLEAMVANGRRAGECGCCSGCRACRIRIRCCPTADAHFGRPCCYVRASGWHALGPRRCCSGCPACSPFCVRVSFRVCSACTSACAGSGASARCGPRVCHRSGT